MDQITNEICSLLLSLYNIATSSEDPQVMLYFQRVVLQEIEPILEHFNI